MKVIVLGAGITGITTAWFLRQQGHEVTVIDRQPGPAHETSRANGCQISVSHAEPWANPSAPWKVLKWLGQEDAPLLYRFKMDPHQWRWCLQFLRECTQSRTDRNIKDIVTMADYSRRTMIDLRHQLGLKYDQLSKGILHFYTDEREFEESLHAAKVMRELGVPRQSVTADEVVKIEPALARQRDHIVGGDFTPTDESGDVYKFTQDLAYHSKLTGVNFMYSTQVTKLVTTALGNRLKSVEVINRWGVHEKIEGDAFVVCMGSYSAALVKPFGVNLLIYPGKGYSATYHVKHSHLAPHVSLTDDEHKIVFSRLGNRLRVAGTCELNGYSRDLNKDRCRALTRRTSKLFPDACDYDNPGYWTGLRPLTPSNVPYIGQAGLSNLYLNTGHGTLGWTMGAGSGRAIADIITHGSSDLDFRFTGRKLLPHFTGTT